ncbi:MAG: PKD domain-containing protein, partial [Candidatus Bipolaricaulota bacterium]|nr:PKD domain-containing protein [Candidatus Bipolaricaulota bacterium]
MARFETSSVVIYAGEKVTFDASSSYGNAQIISYSWTFSEGEETAGQKVDHTYSEAGRYSVTLRIEDSDGRTAQAEREILVYLQSGSDIFHEDFSDGEQALERWSLDPTWASTGEGAVESITGAHGFVLHIRSGADRWHRRSAALTIPPLHVGQRIVFSCQAMMAKTKDAHTMAIFPARKSLDSLTGSLPYYTFTNEGGGSTIREPEAYGGD